MHFPIFNQAKSQKIKWRLHFEGRGEMLQGTKSTACWTVFNYRAISSRDSRARNYVDRKRKSTFRSEIEVSTLTVPK